MNYNHLYYFHVIAQEGSIARASRRLRVSQPTLSEQLKQLEQYFETKLFDRKGGAMRLNNHGRRALEFTESMFDIGDRLVSSFQQPLGSGEILSEVARLLGEMTAGEFDARFRGKESFIPVRLG